MEDLSHAKIVTAHCVGGVCWGEWRVFLLCRIFKERITGKKQPKTRNQKQPKSGKAAQNAEVGFYVKQDTLGVNERTPVRLGTKWKVERQNE